MKKMMQEDTELIENILIGNKQAQEILYERYKKCVKTFLRSKYSQYLDIDDDISEIMIKVFLNLENYDSSKSKFKSWVFSIAKNHMIDKWRSNTSTTTIISGASITTTTYDYIMESDSNYFTYANMGTISMGSTSYCTSTMSADLDFENCNSISFISAQLTPQDFTLLDMKYVQGYDYNEIGTEFNVTSSTISNRVNYIKTKLKKNNPEIIYE